MASSLPPLSLILLIIFTQVLFLPTPQVQSQSLLNQVPPNLAEILHMAGQYSKLINLLCSTEIGCHIEKQLNSSEGITLFAPTDNAFSDSLPNAIYDTLSSDQLVLLMMHHFIPKYLTAAMINSFNGPVPTFATDFIGKFYYLNFDSWGEGEELKVFNGNVETQLTVLYQEFPLVIYQVDKVLLPLEIFKTEPAPVYSVSIPQAAYSPALSPSEEDFVGDLLPFMVPPAMSPSGEWLSSSSAPVSYAPFVEEGSVPSSLCACEMYEVVDAFTNHVVDHNMENLEEQDQPDNMTNADFNLLWKTPKLLYNFIRMGLGIV